MNTETYFIIIGRDDCKWCDAAKIYLYDRGVDFVYKRLEEDVSWAELESEIGNFVTVPQIFFCEGSRKTHVGGYDDLMEWCAKENVL